MDYKEVLKDNEITKTPSGRLVIVTVDNSTGYLNEILDGSICQLCFFFNYICAGGRNPINNLGLDCGDNGFFILEE